VTASIGDAAGDVPPTAPLKVAFSQPMDQQSVQQAIEVHPPVPAQTSWQGNNLVYTPTQAWPDATLVTFTLNASAKTAGGAPLSGPYQYRFVTEPKFDAVELSPADSSTFVPPNAVINVVFSRPVDQATLAANVSISPKVEGTFQQQGRTMTFVPTRPLSLNSTFTVTLGTGIHDTSGEPLPAAKTWRFTTQPQASTPNPGLTPMGGQVVFAGIADPHQLAFTSYGVPSVHLTVYRVPTAAAFVAAYAARPTGNQPNVDTSSFTRITSVDATIPDPNSQGAKLLTIAQTDALGAYYVTASAGATTLPGRFLVVSDRGLLVKQSSTGVLAWITTLADGKPVAGAPVQVYSQDDGKQLLQGSAGADGVFEGAVQPQSRPDGTPFLPNLLVLSGSDAAFTISGTSFDFYAGGYTAVPTTFRTYAYTDRPIYRPGDTVHLRGLVRAENDVHYRLPGDVPVQLTITSPLNGSPLVDQPVHLDAAGNFAAGVPLASSLPTGYYSVGVSVGNARSDVGNSYRGASFQVQEYRKPEYAVTLSVPAGPFVSGDRIPVSVSARYYVDQPVNGAKVKLQVNRAQWFEPYAPGGNQQGDPEAAERGTFRGGFYGDPVQTLDGTLDANGTNTFTLTADLGKLTQSQRYMFEATVTDPANNPVSNVASTVVHRGALVLYAQPKSYATQTGSPVDTAFTVQNLQGQPQAGVPIRCNVIEQTYDVTQEGNQKGAWPVYHLVEVPAYSLTAMSGADGNVASPIVLPRTAGYRVSCSVGDSHGNVVSRDTYLWAASGPAAPYATAGDRLSVATDRTVYAIGDIIKVQVLSPVPDVTALVTVERGKIYSHQLLQFSGSTGSFTLPVTADDVPNVQVSVGAQGRGHILIGAAPVRVPATQRYLSVAVKADKQQYQPGERATITLTATDTAGKPAQGDFSIGVVDEAIYALVDYSQETIKAGFYGPQPVPVLTGASLEAVAGRNGGGGRGGGGGGGASGGSLRTDFPDTAFWSANVHTNAGGQASVQMTMPDSLTTWRITAIGTTPDTQVGYVTADIVATKPFHVQPAFPRFLTAGDQVTLTAIVDNATDAAVPATVTLTADGVTLNDPAQQQAKAPARGSAVLSWRAKVGSGASAATTVQASGGNLSDAIKTTLAILPGGTPRSVNRSGQLTGSNTDVPLNVPADALSGSATLDVAITPTLASGITAGSLSLYGYPYDCAEQTASSFLPAILAKEVYAEAGLTDAGKQLPPDLDQRVAAGLQRLYALQHPDGGWNWWSFDQTDPYMTGYIVYTLVQARQLGYPVVESSLQRGLASLHKQLDSPAAGLSTQAYMLDVLAIAGQPDTARAQTLLARAGEMASYGRGFLAQALQLTGAIDQANQLLAQLGQEAQQTDTTASWHEQLDNLPPLRGSVVYSTAAALDAYTRLDPSNPIAVKAARYLLASRLGTSWDTTHDSAVALMALNRYLLAHGDFQANQHYQASWNGQPLKDVQVTPGMPSASPAVIHVPAAQVRPQNTLHITSDGNSTLFWSAALSYRAAAPKAATGADLRVSRAYLLPDGSPVSGPLAAGSVVKVQLTVHAAAALSYVQITDHLPSGFQPLNPALATTQAQPRPNQPGAPYDHLDLRDAEADFFITALAPGDHQLSYYAQASTPGTFQAPPAVASLMYDPGVSGVSQGASVVVNP